MAGATKSNGRANQYQETIEDAEFLRAINVLGEEFKGTGQTEFNIKAFVDRYGPMISETTIRRISYWRDAPQRHDGSATEDKNFNQTSQRWRTKLQSIETRSNGDGQSSGKKLSISNGFERSTRDRLKLLAAPLKSPMLYHLVGRLLGQKRPDFDKLKEHSGDYSSFRFYPVNDDGRFLYVESLISITTQGQLSIVKHWSHNWKKESVNKIETEEWKKMEPEHEGFAYLTGDRLTLLLFRKNSIRVMTAHVPSERDEPYSGIIQSVLRDKSRHRYAFSCRMIMIKTSDERLLNMYSVEADPDGKKFQGRLLDQAAARFGFLRGD